MASGLRTWIDDDVAHILLNRPERLNPLGPEEWRGIRAHLALAERTIGVRALVIRATGRFFCAGNDLRVIRALNTPDAAREYFLHTQLPTLVALAASPLPVVCVVQADSAGGGIELALYCDLVIAASEARFFLPETEVGLFATTVVAPAAQTVGRQVLQRLALGGERIDALEALRAGLVHRVAPRADLDTTLADVLQSLRRAAPAGVAATKAALNSSLLRHGLTAVEQSLAHLAEELLTSDDTTEGLTAFTEKRTAHWQPVAACDLPRGDLARFEYPGGLR